MVTALSAAPAPMRPFVWLSGMLAKRPNMARAVGTVAGSFIGASQEYDYDSPLDYLELGAIVGVPGVFSLNRARASDQVLHRFSDSINGRMPANLDFNDVMQSASKPGAIVRLQEAMKKAAAGEGGFNPFKIITDEDALYVQALNRNKAIPVSSATFAVELLGSDEAIRQAIKATGGVPGPLSRNINKRLQEQARHLMPLEITDDVVKELSSVMPKLQVVFNDLNSATRNRLMSFLGPDVFPSLRTSTGAFRKQADILAAKVEQQTAVHRIMDQSPEEFNAFLSGLRTAGKIAQKTGLPESTLDPKALRVADDMAEQISVQRFKFIEEAFKGEYFRQNILMSAAKPLSEATGETVSEGVLKGAWVFDGASMFKYIKTNEKHLKNIYGPETTAAFKDLASLIDYGQHLEQEAVTGVRQAGNRLMSFYTHRLAFKLTTGGVTQGPGTGFGGLLLGMAGLQTVTETADFLISASRMSQLAIEEPEVVSNLWKAVQSGDLVRQQNAVRGVLSRVAPDNDSAQDNESPF